MPQSHHTFDSPAPISLGRRPRILIVKLASLGDLLLATPALRALRLRYPEARIDVLTTGGSANLLRESRLIDSVYTLDKYAFDSLGAILRKPWHLLHLLPALAALRHNDYHAVLLLHHLTLAFGRVKYRALLSAIHPRCTAGLENGHGSFLDLRVPDFGFGDRHEADYALAVAASVGATLPLHDRGLRLADLSWNEALPCPCAAPPLIALHPGSGSYSLARRWPAARYAEVAATLHSDLAADVVLVGGPDERELHARILDKLDFPTWAVSEAGQHSPRQLARRLSQCVVFIGNDSFPMHLAVAVGIPVVAIFGPSNVRAWGPYAPHAPHRVTVVRRSDLPCSPCFYRGHSLGTPGGCPGRPCLTELGAEPVLRAARRMIQSSLAGASPAG